MGLYTVLYSCGHSAARQLYGKHADRERFVAWAAREGLCDICQAERTVARCEALEAEFGLPQLLGTDKQVAWARQIRSNVIPLIEEYLTGAAPRVPEDRKTLYEEHCAAVRQALMAKSAARWWIDHRDLGPRTLAEDLYREARA